MSNLVKHAEYELKRAGLFDEDSDYGGMLGPAILKVVEAFSGQGHSGMSASISLDILTRLLRFKPLTPITNEASEWMNVSEYGGPDSKPIWQNVRSSDCFSNDGGKTHYSIDDPKLEVKTTDAALSKEKQ